MLYVCVQLVGTADDCGSIRKRCLNGGGAVDKNDGTPAPFCLRIGWFPVLNSSSGKLTSGGSTSSGNAIFLISGARSLGLGGNFFSIGVGDGRRVKATLAASCTLSETACIDAQVGVSFEILHKHARERASLKLAHHGVCGARTSLREHTDPLLSLR